MSASLADRIRDIAVALDGAADHDIDDAVTDLLHVADQVDQAKIQRPAETTRHTQQSSCSIDRLSSGKHTISIKVYDDDPEVALSKAVELLAKAEADVAAQADGGES